jgi:hypothetical protein
MLIGVPFAHGDSADKGAETVTMQYEPLLSATTWNLSSMKSSRTTGKTQGFGMISPLAAPEAAESPPLLHATGELCLTGDLAYRRRTDAHLRPVRARS